MEAAYEPYAGARGSRGDGRAPGAIVLAHGFSGSVNRPALRRAAQVFAQYGAVITFSFRGHGNSGGHSTVGDREVLDLAAAVGWARSMGHEHVATVGFSMGGSVVVRHGALYRPYTTGTGDLAPTEAHEGRPGALPVTVASSGLAPSAQVPGELPDAYAHSDTVEHAHSDTIVAVSAPARWYYRGTAPMRRLHWVIQRPVGRLVSRYGLRTRIHPHDWDPVPLSPVAAASALAPTPLLVVHGDQDPYFPLDHPQSLAEAADPDCSELWVVPGLGHAENAAEPELLRRIGTWITARWPSAAERPA
nr:alpha/beta hydrolase [Streptomyces albidus (ex Kaewkla and Franco 2022)]